MEKTPKTTRGRKGRGEIDRACLALRCVTSSTAPRYSYGFEGQQPLTYKRRTCTSLLVCIFFVSALDLVHDALIISVTGRQSLACSDPEHAHETVKRLMDAMILHPQTQQPRAALFIVPSRQRRAPLTFPRTATALIQLHSERLRLCQVHHSHTMSS